MAEKYVSVSELRKLLGIPSDGQCTGCRFVTLHGCKDDALRRACEAIDDAPEADVRPVKRGKWIKRGCWIFCSKCKEKKAVTWNTTVDELINTYHLKFCNNCGADMREVKADEK